MNDNEHIWTQEELFADNQRRATNLQRQGVGFAIPNFYHELLMEAIATALYPNIDILAQLKYEHEGKVSDLLDQIEEEVRKATITQGVTIMKPHGI